MEKRKRIFTPVGIRWEANPYHELVKLRAKEHGITYREASNLLQLEHELAKI